MNAETDNRKKEKTTSKKKDIYQELTPSANVERGEFLNVINPEEF